MKHLKKSFSILIIIASIFSCNNDSKKKNYGIVVENMDTSVRPNDDFYRYANGNWLDKTEIPSDRVNWSVFSELRKKTDTDILNILNESIEKDNFPKLKDANGNLKISDQQKVAYFYQRDRYARCPVERRSKTVPS